MNQWKRLEEALKKHKGGMAVYLETRQDGQFFVSMEEWTSRINTYTPGKYYDTIEEGIKFCLDFLEERKSEN